MKIGRLKTKRAFKVKTGLKAGGWPFGQIWCWNPVRQRWEFCVGKGSLEF